jgi:hypothetical protein
MKQKSYSKFVSDFVELMSESTQTTTKKYFYANPFIHGTAHPGTDFITQSRNILFANMTRYVLFSKVGRKKIITNKSK